MNQIEIERKWILLNYPQTSHTLKQISQVSIEQYYASDGFRYRWESCNGRHVFYKLKKIKLDEGIYNEVDIEEIKGSEYDNNRLDNPIISKKRTTYRYVYAWDLKFEMDDYWPHRLLTLEVELPSIDHKFTMPANIASQIIKEVTGEVEFSNRSLAEKLKIPYVK